MPYLSRLSSRLALRLIGTATLMAVLMLTGACSDRTTAPAAPTPDAASSARMPDGVTPTVSYSRSTSSGGEHVSGVKRGTKLNGVSASVDVDWRGGKLDIGKAGFHLIIPPFAVARRTHITVTAMPGDAMAYEFEPHGLVFAVPLLMEQDLSGSSWERNVLDLPRLGYFASESDLNLLDAVALIEEWVPSGIGIRDKKFYALIPHFSGYMVSSGRR